MKKNTEIYIFYQYSWIFCLVFLVIVRQISKTNSHHNFDQNENDHEKEINEKNTEIYIFLSPSLNNLSFIFCDSMENDEDE